MFPKCYQRNKTQLMNLFSALSVQLLSEKISGAEGTKLDEDFMEMERVSSVQVSAQKYTWC